MPVTVQEVEAELLEGPVLVTIEYSVLLENEAEFIRGIRQYAGRGVAMVRISGESNATPKRPIGLWRSSWCIRGQNIFVNTSARQKRIGKCRN
jgi:hypothetical protein